MIRLYRKISIIILACILILNAGTTTGMVMGHCSTTMNAGHMDMDHCDGILNFALPNHGCCGDCLDIFCDLFNNPFKDVNTAPAFTSQDYVQEINARSGDIWEETDIRLANDIAANLFSAVPQKGPLRLYIEHLTLII